MGRTQPHGSVERGTAASCARYGGAAPRANRHGFLDVFGLGLLAALVAHGAAAQAREVVVPLRLDHEFLRQALVTQVYTDPNQTARVWDDGTGCNYLTLSSPRVDTHQGKVRVTSAGTGRVGTSVGKQCLVVLDWTGTVEVLEEPRVEPGVAVVRFAVVDSQIYGPEGRKQVSAKLWDWVKKYVHPRLETLTIDLQAALDELRAFLPHVLPSDDVARTQRLLDSLSLARVQPSETGITADVRFDVPLRPPAAETPPPEPALSPEELRRWETAWQRWDAFLTFVLKQAAADSGVAELRVALLDVLLDARHDLLEALAPSRPGQPDPVRPLFLKTWARLAPALRHLSTGLPGEAALRYLSFIAAADALQAIDQLGPDSGLDISADGLRRLARMVAPAAIEDPLAYSIEVDPELRRLFGFGPPLPPPGENPDVELSAGEKIPAPRARKAGAVLPPLVGAGSRFAPARWFWPAPAWAAIEPDRETVARLNRWVPTPDELDVYLPLVRDLLQTAAGRTLATHELEPQFHQLYRWAVLATAWQETCWRQFLKVGGKMYPIKSPVGSVGLMQVNQNVWRGFYDVKGLQQDISYNANAGCEILLQYLRDHAIAKGEHTVTGSIDNLARATYSVYNAGPGQLQRYRKSNVAKRARRVDEAFWKKYQAVKAGNELNVAECYGR